MRYTKTKSNPGTRAKALVVLSAAAGIFLGQNRADAAQSPAGCTANNFTVNISKNHNNITNGTVVTYVITVQNLADPSTCDITLGAAGLDFVCPGSDGTPATGTTNVLIAGGTTLPGGTTGFGPVSFTNQCTININPGVKTAQVLVTAPGALLHDNPLIDDPANINKTLSVNVFTPCIEVVKQCAATCTPYGQPIGFTGTITNCGDVALVGVGLVDDQAGLILGPTNALAVGGTLNFSGSYTPSGNLCGPFTDTVTATGTAPLDTSVGVTNTASATCHVSTTPGLGLTKDCFKTGSPGARSLNVGDTFVEVFTVTNTGNVPLSGVLITDVSSKTGTITTNAGPLDINGTATITIGPFTVVAGDCPSISDSATAIGTNSCPADTTCPSSATVSAGPATCALTVICPPCISVSKLISCGPCGANPGSLSYGPMATGVAGTNNPAFCYQIIVTNCGAVTLTNVQVSDPTLGLSITLPTNLPPGTVTAPIFTGASFGVGMVTNTVTATGQSEQSGQTVSNNASAVAIVVPASLTCKVDLSSSVNQNTNNSPPCEVTLPSGSVNSPVTVTLTLNNTGQADLNVSIVGGDILSSGLVNCSSGAAVSFGTVFVPAGGTTNFVAGCVAVSCPGTNISTVVQGTAVASKSVPCVLSSSGTPITTATSSCSQCVNCLVSLPCIQVSKLIACGPCGSNPAGLSYGPSATGMAGTNDPAFCYQIIVSNCDDVTLTNVQISDPTLGLAVTLPTNLPPHTATAPIFHGASYGVGSVTNIVTATGQSQDTGQSTSAQASAVAIVVPASVTCNLSLSSSLNQNTNGSGACRVTLPAGTSNAPVTVTLTINNTGSADLDVNIIGGDIMTSALIDCSSGASVTLGSVFVPAGMSTNVVLGCVDVSCPGTTISAVVQGTGVPSKSIQCAFDSSGTVITTAPSSCQDCVNCAAPTGAGCTPGFWKNCTQQWLNTGFSTGQSVSSVFTVPSCVGNLGNATLLQALSFKGGSSVNGAAQTLLRAAVAGLLNSAKIDYPLTTAQVISQVNTALASCDRDTILTLASTIDGLNNLGCRDKNGNDLPCHTTSPVFPGLVDQPKIDRTSR